MAAASRHEAPDIAPRRLGDLPGSGILAVSWASTVAFALTAGGDRLGIDGLELPATVTALVLFAAGVSVWIAAFVRAVARSTEEDVTLGGLFFLMGTAPRPVQVQLLGSLASAVAVAAATATEAPFGVMEPVLPLALAGLWGARHGEFRRRKDRRA